MGVSHERVTGWGRVSRVVAVTSVVVIVMSVVAVVVPLVRVSTPEFFSRYHLLNRRYVNLSNSAHEGVGCRTCHETHPVANGLALVREYYSSLVTTGPVPRYFTFGPPRNEACLRCHEHDWSADSSRTARIPHPAHARVREEKRPCVGCHKWTAHFEAYLDKHKSMPFSGVCVSYGCHVGTKSTSECFDCHHVLHEEGEQWRSVHVAVAKRRGQSVCTESCHTVGQCQQCHTTGKRPRFDGLPIEVSMKSIETLHVRDDWTKTFHGTEALKDRSRCLRCHLSEGECEECHLERPAFHGKPLTWIGRHNKSASSVTDPRCLECHQRTWCEQCHEQFKEMG